MIDRDQAILFRSMFAGMGDDAAKDGSEMAAHMPLLFLLASTWSFGDVVELGVGRGWSTIALLTALAPLKRRLISYDSLIERKACAIRNWQVGPRHPALAKWDFRVKDSLNAANDFPDEAVSLLFIDSSHEYRHTLAELQAWSPKVAAQGVVCGHDYLLHLRPDWSGRSGVKEAVDQFVVKYAERWKLQVFPHDQGLFILWPRNIWDR